MEFYFSTVGGYLLHRSFNSQRDGILRTPYPLVLRRLRRFNSKRDGILHSVVCSYICTTTFQFPTGWNSTAHRRGEKLCRCGVSIPNGMEFYEGISSRLRVSSLVSIPNGMEFYADMLQKDFAYTPLFQFPTGWNSTIDVVSLYCT